MKHFKFLIILLFLSVNSFAQLSNTFYHQNGLKLTYTLKQINSDKENFDKYEVYLKVENSNNYKIYLNIGENYLRFQSNNIYNLSENYGGTSFNIGNDLYYSCNGNLASCLVNENETYEKNIFPMNFYVVRGKTPVLIDWKLNSWYELKLDSCKNNVQNIRTNNDSSSTNTVNATINKSNTPTESHKQKMLSVLEEISEYLSENNLKIIVKKIVSGETVFYEEDYQYTIKFRLNGCNGNITVTDVIGNNSKYNEFVKNLLLKLDGKYVVKEDENCFTQPATMKIGFD